MSNKLEYPTITTASEDKEQSWRIGCDNLDADSFIVRFNDGDNWHVLTLRELIALRNRINDELTFL
jgi:hypothetical protein